VAAIASASAKCGAEQAALPRVVSDGGGELDSRGVDQEGFWPPHLVYELTAAGSKQLGVEKSRWGAVSSRIYRVLREA